MKKEVLKQLKVFLLSVLLVLILVGCGNEIGENDSEERSNEKGASVGKEDETYTIKVGLGQPISHSYYKAFEKFKNEVETKSNQRLKVEIYANSQLGGEREMQEAVSLGTLDMCLTGVLVSQEPLLAVLELPYLFENRDQVKKFHKSDAVKKLSQSLEKQNIMLIAFYENGFRQVTNNKKAITTVEDVNGLKLRTPENPAQIETFKQLGAVVTPMSSSELYGALQQGVVDGQENPLQNIDSNKFYEVQKYLAITNHIYNSGYVIMSKNIYDDFPDDLQEIVTNAIQESAEYQMDLVETADKTLIGELQEKGMEISNPDQSEFREKAEPVYELFYEKYGDEAKELVDAIRSFK